METLDLKQLPDSLRARVRQIPRSIIIDMLEKLTEEYNRSEERFDQQALKDQIIQGLGLGDNNSDETDSLESAMDNLSREAEENGLTEDDSQQIIYVK